MPCIEYYDTKVYIMLFEPNSYLWSWIIRFTLKITTLIVILITEHPEKQNVLRNIDNFTTVKQIELPPSLQIVHYYL